jgi:hypothetical protein
MKPADIDPDLLSRWEGAVAFRLFADQAEPAHRGRADRARVGERISTAA